MRLKRIVALLIATVMLCTSFAVVSFAEEDVKLVVFYTNDVHCGIESTLGYDDLAALKQRETENGNTVVLADAGDAVQGGTIGSLSQGEYIVDIMNHVGYDVAVPGNHEFDYGTARLIELAKKAKYSYVSENFVHLPSGEAVFSPYYMTKFGDIDVAFVGICTPHTYTSAAPKYFQNEKGEYIYSFCGGDEFYASIQGAVDNATNDGADIVIALAHLGVGESLSPYSSTDIIANTEGIDAVIDGHSHTVIPGEELKNKVGENVLLTSTGTKFANIGKMTITPDGKITTELISEYDAASASGGEKAAYDKTAEYIEGIKAKYGEMLSKVVAKSDVTLTVNDPSRIDPVYKDYRLVRRGETNMGDFCADAYRTVMGSDIAFVNGGGIRANIEKGDVTYGDIINVHPFGNMICSALVTGQQIIDALEMGAASYPDESGGFLQVSGMSYDIDATIPSPVVMDEFGSFASVDGERRVKNVLIGSQPVDIEKTYTLAGSNYMLKSGGDGLSMFNGITIVKDETYVDSEVLIKYAAESLSGSIGSAQYAGAYGQGRINILHDWEFSDVKSHWAEEYIYEVAKEGYMTGVAENTFAPDDTVTNAMMATVMYRIKNAPEAGEEPFDDVDDKCYYQAPVAWANENGIMSGISETEFAPDENITGEKVTTIIRTCFGDTFSTQDYASKNEITRGELAALIAMLFEKVSL